MIFQGLADGEFVLGPSYEGVTFADGSTSVVYFNQMDERFANKPYGTDNIEGYTCGPTAMSIVVSSFTSDKVEGCTASEPQRIVDALSSGKLVVAIMSQEHFTKSGHFIVLKGVTSQGNILVADPASYKRNQQEWDLSIILTEARKARYLYPPAELR